MSVCSSHIAGHGSWDFFFLVANLQGYVYFRQPDAAWLHLLSSRTAIAVYMSGRTVLSFCPQSDVVQQSIYNLIHKDDRETFRRQLHFSELRGESKNST